MFGQDGAKGLCVSAQISFKEQLFHENMTASLDFHCRSTKTTLRRICLVEVVPGILRWEDESLVRVGPHRFAIGMYIFKTYTCC